MDKDSSIVLREGLKKGKTVAVFCGVHGNEKAGVLAVRKILKEIKITAGKVYFIFANPEAIKKNMRYVEKNLNRCFLENNNGKTLEDRRAIELMNILDKCEILLDLHASNSMESIPFVICEENGLSIAEKLDFEIISSGWDVIEPGATDGYMNNNGKIGICLECGSVFDSKEKSNLAEKSIYQFLKYTGNIVSEIEYTERERRFINVIREGKKKTPDFSFVRDFKDFEKLREGEVFARDGIEEYVAGKDEIIIFPNPNKKIGDEVFVIGKCFMQNNIGKAK